MPVLIEPDWLITSAAEEAHQGWAVLIEGDRIVAVGPAEEIEAADAVVTGGICAPGFVNTHVHMYGVLAHGIPLPDVPSDFWAFLADFWWPRVEDALDVEMIAAATDYVCAEMVRSGTTTFYDILEAPNAIPSALLAEKEVVERRGLRGILSFEATERVSAKNAKLGLDENADLITACRREGSLVSGLMCFHTTFTCSEPFIRSAFERAADLEVLTHCHVNEGVYEPEQSLEHFGVRTLERYESMGVASDRMLASQCVQLSEAECKVIADTGIRCSHMPLSNCEVGGGIAPMPELLADGVTVGLGTDGYVNDMYEVMRGAFLIHKGRLCDPLVMPAREVFGLATEGGARALGLEQVGRLEAGWAADLQLVAADVPTPIDAENVFDQLVLWRSGSHVTDVMVAGEWRVRNGEVLDADVDAMRAATRTQAERLWAF